MGEGMKKAISCPACGPSLEFLTPQGRGEWKVRYEEIRLPIEYTGGFILGVGVDSDPVEFGFPYRDLVKAVEVVFDNGRLNEARPLTQLLRDLRQIRQASMWPFGVLKARRALNRSLVMRY